MTGVETIVAVFIFICSLVGLVVWFGRAAAKAEQREDELETALGKQSRMVKLLSLRSRSRDELIDWMHKKSGSKRPTMPPTRHGDG